MNLVELRKYLFGSEEYMESRLHSFEGVLYCGAKDHNTTMEELDELRDYVNGLPRLVRWTNGRHMPEEIKKEFGEKLRDASYVLDGDYGWRIVAYMLGLASEDIEKGEKVPLSYVEKVRKFVTKGRIPMSNYFILNSLKLEGLMRKMEEMNIIDEIELSEIFERILDQGHKVMSGEMKQDEVDFDVDLFLLLGLHEQTKLTDFI